MVLKGKDKQREIANLKQSQRPMDLLAGEEVSQLDQGHKAEI